MPAVAWQARVMHVRGIAVLFAALALFVGACADTGTQGDSTTSAGRTTAPSSAGGSVVAAAAASTTAAGTAAVEVDATTTLGDFQIPMTGGGAIDLETGDSRMTLAAAVPGEPTQEFELLVVDSVEYTRGPPGFAPNEWVRVTDAPDNGSQLGFSDPTATLDTLKDLGATVEEIGTDTVRETQVTRYRADLGGDELAEQMQSQLTQMGIEPGSEQADLLDDSTFVTEVAVDADGLIRQLQTTITVPVSGEMTDAGFDELVFDSTYTLTDFGVPLDLTLPADVTEVTQLEMQQRQAQAGSAQDTGG